MNEKTKILHSVNTDVTFDPLSFPIYQTTTFRKRFDEDTKYSYSRTSNPTRTALERTVATLDEGKYAFAFSSGLAAVNSCFSLLGDGDHVIVGDDLYGGVYRFLNNYATSYGISFTFVDTTDIEKVRKVIRSNTKMLYIESPTNPMMKVSDIEMLSRLTKEHGLLFVVDNTFLTPANQKPLTLGADMTVYSGTKYLSGHNDSTAGLVVTRDETLAKKLELASNTLGNALSPFDSWLVLRGLKTLYLRMERHEQNAKKVAEFLKGRRGVEKVLYVGDRDNEGYELIKKQSKGFGGMISFMTDSEERAMKALSSVRMISFAESLGGVESLITHPYTQTHYSIPENVKEKIGITKTLLRLSVGIEASEDIIAELDRVLG